MEDKIIVSNRKALTNKYGSKGWRIIHKALAELIKADKKRGIVSRVFYIDNQRGMKRIKGKAVANISDPRQNKEAIDAVFNFFEPHYLVILGANDIIPHQDLDNPIFGNNDDDSVAWGDLPYACDEPYSRDPAKFVGPTRVIGRIPDLVGGNKPSYLLSLIKTAASYTQRTPEDYVSYFGLSAKAWQSSTRLSLDNIFGNADKLMLAPPSGPKYPDRELQSRIHFINCHGGPSSPEFSGQGGRTYPVSLTMQSTIGEISDGTVASVECCYGAELYDSVTLGIDKPICQSYLQQGAYGYFGSTTIAYGPAEGNGAADLICQYFLLHVLNGSSIGRAVLMARQEFVGQVGQMDAVDLKTLSQFYLLGDPSIHPVAKTSATNIPKGMTSTIVEHVSRSERREKMKMAGSFLKDTKPTASKQVPIGKLSTITKTALSNIAKKAGLSLTQDFLAFNVKETPVSIKAKDAKKHMRYLIAVGIPKKETASKIMQGIAVVAKELDGRIIDYRIYHQR